MIAPEVEDAINDIPKSDPIRIPHRAAALSRKSVAVDVDNIDVDCAQRKPFLEDLCTLVHEREDRSLHDFFRPNRPAPNPGLLGTLLDELLHLGVRSPSAVVG